MYIINEWITSTNFWRTETHSVAIEKPQSNLLKYFFFRKREIDDSGSQKHTQIIWYIWFGLIFLIIF